jgi:hypothetical protein
MNLLSCMAFFISFCGDASPTPRYLVTTLIITYAPRSLATLAVLKKGIQKKKRVPLYAQRPNCPARADRVDKDT